MSEAHGISAKKAAEPGQWVPEADTTEMKDFVGEWEPLPVLESYYPTRLEYFAGKALQGFVTGRAEKDLRSAAKRALILAFEMVREIDSANSAQD